MATIRGRVLCNTVYESKSISKEEIYRSLKYMKNDKTPREDGIVAEAIKIGESLLIDKIQELLNFCLYNQNPHPMEPKYLLNGTIRL